jgi:hypothetical protein
MSPTPKVFDWNEQAVDKLIAMYKKGLSARKIAEVLGHGLTRNAIIGKWERLRKTGRLPSLSDKVIILKLHKQRLTTANANKMRNPKQYLPKPVKIIAPKLFVFPKAPVRSLVKEDKPPSHMLKQIPSDTFTPLEGTTPRHLAALTRQCCRWPVGEDLFCCEPVQIMTERLSSYCPTHRRISYRAA